MTDWRSDGSSTDPDRTEVLPAVDEHPEYEAYVRPARRTRASLIMASVVAAGAAVAYFGVAGGLSSLLADDSATPAALPAMSSDHDPATPRGRGRLAAAPTPPASTPPPPPSPHTPAPLPPPAPTPEQTTTTPRPPIPSPAPDDPSPSPTGPSPTPTDPPCECATPSPSQPPSPSAPPSSPQPPPLPDPSAPPCDEPGSGGYGDEPCDSLATNEQPG